MMTRTVQVRLRFPNPGDCLRPNMFANVAIGAESKQQVLTIPQSAVIRSSRGDRVILALGEGRFRPAEVKTGMESGGNSEASLDAGLLRMAPPENEETTPMEMDGMSMSEMNTPANDMKESDAVGAEGRVVSVDMEAKSITIDHEPVPEIGWPSMVMAFKAPSNIDLMSVKAGAPVRFAFRETEAGYELEMIEPMPKPAGDEQ